MSAAIAHSRPFRVEAPEADLADLHRRLAATRWQHVIDDAGWDYGADQAYVRELCDYWRSQFDWRAAETRLNAYPQYLHEVDGVDLHFLHVHSGRFPLLLVHGWPGSVWEFIDTLDPLAADFDLVVVSLPGFGFSGKPRERGWGVARIAAALDTLMRDLGYARYGAQGGDWGAIICSHLAATRPDSCVALHVNQTWAARPRPLPDELADWAVAHDRYLVREGGYSHVQSTKPDSLTLAQNDSPAGLAAWIVEKFRTWGDTGGDIESAFGRDDLLANLMFYWLPQAAGSAARIYAEVRDDPAARERPPVSVPTAVANFPAEPFALPRQIVETRYQVVRWTDMPRGGHFAALEQPDLLVEDIRGFFAGRA
jgi:epoxide hydrolase